MTEAQLREKLNNLRLQQISVRRHLRDLQLQAAYERGYSDCQLDRYYEAILFSPDQPIFCAPAILDYCKPAPKVN